MSSTTLPRPAVTNAPPGIGFARVLASEAIKATTLRLPWWIAGATAAAVALLTGGMLWLLLLSPDVPDPAQVVIENFGPQPMLGALGMVFLVSYAFVAILSVLLVAPERGSGLLATTLAAVPQRRPVYLAKLVVAAVMGAVLGLIGAALAWLLGAPVLQRLGFPAGDWDTDLTQVIVGGVVFLALIGVLSVALASLLPSTASASGTVLGLYLVVPALVQLVPGVGGTLAGLMPSSAGMLLVQPASMAGWASVLTGGLVLLAWTIAAAVVGGVLFQRRDV